MSNELNTRIAVALGWFEPFLNEWGYDTFRALKDIPWKTGGGAFESGGIIDNPYVLCPDWQHDLNAAYLLLLELPSFHIEVAGGLPAVYWLQDVAGNRPRIQAVDVTPQALAEAICVSWLQCKGASDE